MPNQYNAAQFANVPSKTGPSDEEAQPADKVHDFRDATPKLGKLINYGSTEEAHNGGSGANKVVDHQDAPFKLNKDPHLQSSV